MPVTRLPAVWDLSTKFEPLQIGSALSKVWCWDGPNLVPAVETDGERVHCPITLHPLQEPVLLGDGSIYERNAITKWLAENKDGRAPLTNLKLPHTAMLSLEPLRMIVEVVMSQTSMSPGSHILNFQMNALMKEALERLDSTGSEVDIWKMSQDLDDCIDRSKAEIRRLQESVLAAEQLKKRLSLLLGKNSPRKDVAEQSAKQIRIALQVFHARSQLYELSHQRQKISTAVTTVKRFAQRFLAQTNLIAERHQVHRVQQLGQQLQVACQNGNAQLVRLFLERRADPNLSEGKDPSHQAAVASPCLMASQMGHSEILRMLYHAGADINARSLQGNTPLVAAAQLGLSQVVATLILSSADMEKPSIEPCHWATPLFVAAQSGHSSVVHLLCQAGAGKAITKCCGAALLDNSTQMEHGDLVFPTLCQGAMEQDQPPDGDATTDGAMGVSEERARGGMDAKAWFSLATKGGGIVNGHNYTKLECIICACELNPKYDIAWNNLGIAGGGVVNGCFHTMKECYINAIEVNPHLSLAWNNIGTVGGGIIDGRTYSRKECYIRALELKASSPLAWNSLGVMGGGTVNERTYTKKECYICACEADSNYAPAWKNLGIRGGGSVNGRSYTQQECYTRACELKTILASAQLATNDS